MNSKRKGSGGEREVLTALLSMEGVKAERNDQRYLSGKGLPDILAATGEQEYHIEVKRAENIRLNEWIAQAERDVSFTPWRIPLIVFRKNRAPWYCVIKASDLLKMLKIKKKEDKTE